MAPKPTKNNKVDISPQKQAGQNKAKYESNRSQFQSDTVSSDQPDESIAEKAKKQKSRK